MVNSSAHSSLLISRQVAIWLWIVFPLLFFSSEACGQSSDKITEEAETGHLLQRGSEAGDRRDTNPPRVDAVYPTSDELPENLLRFYVYFSEPMQQSQNPFKHIRLFDADAKVVQGAFIENRFDLWSPCGTRLTVLFDPGRVKTGLVAHEVMGRAMKAGNKYQLVVSDTLLTAKGSRLTKKHQKTFRAVEARMDSRQLSKWELVTPCNATREPLAIHLDGTFDHLSLAYRIRVKDSKGKPIRGRLWLKDKEETWVFAPDTPWLPGTYTIAIDKTLEDICGNRIGERFDQPLTKETSAKPHFCSVQFEIFGSTKKSVDECTE